MATQEQKQLVAEKLREDAERMAGKESGAMFRRAQALYAVALELDPPAPHTVTVQGVRFSYEAGRDNPWVRHVTDAEDFVYGTLTKALASCWIDPTLAEYESLLALQTEAK